MITNLRNHTYDYKTDGSIYNIFSNSHEVNLKIDFLTKDYSSRLKSFVTTHRGNVSFNKVGVTLLDEEFIFLATIADKNTDMVKNIEEKYTFKYKDGSSFNIYIVNYHLNDTEGYAFFENVWVSKNEKCKYLSLFIEKELFEMKQKEDELSEAFSCLISELAEYDVNYICAKNGVPLNRDYTSNTSFDIILRDKFSTSDCTFIFDYVSLIVYIIATAFSINGFFRMDKSEIIKMIPIDLMVTDSREGYSEHIDKYVEDIISATIELFNDELSTKEFNLERVEIALNIYDYINSLN
jgi:hypothetical protein